MWALCSIHPSCQGERGAPQFLPPLPFILGGMGEAGEGRPPHTRSRVLSSFLRVPMGSEQTHPFRLPSRGLQVHQGPYI